MFWLDIDDLLHHLEAQGRPSGIQRVVHELGAALHRMTPGEVRFLRRGEGALDFRIVDWAEVEAAFVAAMRNPAQDDAQPPADGEAAADGDAGVDPGPPPGLLAAAGSLGAAQLRTAAAIGRLAVGIGLAGGRSGRRAVARLAAGVTNVRTGTADGVEEFVAPAAEIVEAEAPDFATFLRPGDVFVTLGSPWHHEDYARTVRWLRDERRVGFALLIHDLVPIRHPEWCDRGVIRTFRDWHRAVLPLADVIFTLSRATAEDVRDHLRSLAIDVPLGVVEIPAGISHALTTVEPTPAPVVEGRYVLFVSTIEARKNHALLLKVWRRLLDDPACGEVPMLVFAGRQGWLVDDLMQQLDNTGWLDGRIRFVRSPSDAELRRLYADCLFTVFPSLFEGFGLPVAESLSLGRPCVASASSAIPEAGGPLARYFNPVDVGEASREIAKAVADADALARWTEQVRRDYHPASWDDGAAAIIAACDASPSRPAPR